MGTLWNASSPGSDLQQTLLTSNGGTMNQVYLPCNTTIKLGSNLPINLYSMRQDFGPMSNPFVFVAALRGSDVIPGTFYVSYVYEFKNPIGSAWDYGVIPFIYPADVEPHDTASVVLLEDTEDYGPGTVFLYDNGRFTHEGEEVELGEDVFLTEYWADQSDFNDPSAFLPSLYGVWNDHPSFTIGLGLKLTYANASNTSVATGTVSCPYDMIPLSFLREYPVDLAYSN